MRSYGLSSIGKYNSACIYKVDSGLSRTVCVSVCPCARACVAVRMCVCVWWGSALSVPASCVSNGTEQCGSPIVVACCHSDMSRYTAAIR